MYQYVYVYIIYFVHLHLSIIILFMVEGRGVTYFNFSHIIASKQSKPAYHVSGTSHKVLGTARMTTVCTSGRKFNRSMVQCITGI